MWLLPNLKLPRTDLKSAFSIRLAHRVLLGEVALDRGDGAVDQRAAS